MLRCRRAAASPNSPTLVCRSSFWTYVLLGSLSWHGYVLFRWVKPLAPNLGPVTVWLACAVVQVRLTDPRQSMKKGFVEFEVKSLATIMKELKHTWIDVLKIDIEGAEWPVLKALIRSKKPLPFTQLQARARGGAGVFPVSCLYLHILTLWLKL